jgi:carboxymethylenebutenolidase
MKLNSKIMNLQSSPQEVKIDNEVFALYDIYCHGGMSRRDFLSRASLVATSGLMMAQALLPDYAKAQTISFTDDRIKAKYVTYDSSGGNGSNMRGYLVQPKGVGPFPVVVVIHENRGLNPYVEDVARRLATEGFLALAPDGLFPLGGYPGNDDDGRDLQSRLDGAKLRIDMLNSAQFLRSHVMSNGNLGVTGFCWGGSTTNFLAGEMGADLLAAVPYYGAPPEASKVSNIKAKMLIHYAEKDTNMNPMWPNYEIELKKNNIDYQMFSYSQTQHGFHNNSTPRYNEGAAKLSWNRTISHFKKYLG